MVLLTSGSIRRRCRAAVRHKISSVDIAARAGGRQMCMALFHSSLGAQVVVNADWRQLSIMTEHAERRRR